MAKACCNLRKNASMFRDEEGVRQENFKETNVVSNLDTDRAFLFCKSAIHNK